MPADPSELGNLLDEHPNPLRGWARVGLFVAVVPLLIVGIAGLALPIIPGIPLILIGLFLLSRISPRARHLINALDRHLPTKIRRMLRSKKKNKPSAPDALPAGPLPVPLDRRLEPPAPAAP